MTVPQAEIKRGDSVWYTVACLEYGRPTWRDLIAEVLAVHRGKVAIQFTQPLTGARESHWVQMSAVRRTVIDA